MMTPQLIRSRRRTIGLHVTADARLIVRAPLRAPLSTINQFISETMPWILKKQNEAQARLQLTAEKRRLDEERFLECGENYRERAAEIIGLRARIMAEAHGFNYSRVRISNARSRWGSCSSKGTLSFTWRLMMAPEWVIDYVVAHELAHLEHRNHSRHFWFLVSQLHPQFKEARRWLRDNQHIMLLGR